MKKCEHCSKEFEPLIPKQRFCSRQCMKNWHYGHRKQSQKQPRICKYCGKEYIPKALDRTTYCSRECSFADKAKRCKTCGKVITGRQSDYCSEECKLKTQKCIWCGQEFESTTAAGYCSDDCRKAKAREGYRNSFVSVRETNPIIKKKCKNCGEVFQVNYYSSIRQFCSDECARKYFREDYKETRKKQMARAFVEPVSFRKIYQRDNGICQICGQPVAYDKAPEDPMGATIDHVIPLSKGGKHHPDNCQLAHRICNSLKGDKVPEAIRTQRGRA